MTKDYKKNIDELLPPDWNPSDEEFQELEEEYAIASQARSAIATTPEGWAEIEKERERWYLEELQIRESQAVQQ